MKIENLQSVYYYNGEYELEFFDNGKFEYIHVDADDHPEAETDEDYFDDEEVIKKILEGEG